MPFIEYIPRRFHKKAEYHISKANEVLDEYAGQGLSLTLRQLYYQFVSRDIIPNSFKEYRKLQDLVSNARLAGRIDWEMIEDRTRNLQDWEWYHSPESALAATARAYAENKWETQPNHVEVWVEKDALIGVIEKACRKYSTPFFSCRGYASQSEIWNSAQRLGGMEDLTGQSKKPVVILHLGDHDPSGVDMSRDMQDRFNLFEAENVEVRRIALTMNQIRAKNPPPNPAKLTDSRAKEYIKRFGSKSWELDALDPTFMIDLIHSETEALLDADEWEKATARESENKEAIQQLSSEFHVASRFVANPDAIQNFEYFEEDQQNQLGE